MLVAGGGYAVWRAVKAPAAPAFYDAPSPLGTDRPGRILRTQAIDARDTGARIWRIIYSSTDRTGALVPVSGLIAAPTAPAADGALVAVAHGTVGINRDCAPRSSRLRRPTSRTPPTTSSSAST